MTNEGPVAELVAAFEELFLQQDVLESAGPHSRRVQEQYPALAPIVLAEALHRAITGEGLPERLFETIRLAARDAARLDIPVSVVARGEHARTTLLGVHSLVSSSGSRLDNPTTLHRPSLTRRL
jgi:hypothetical protein